MKIGACIIKDAGKEIIPACVIENAELEMPKNGIYEPSKFLNQTKEMDI